MSSFGGWGVPGQGALAETSEREIIWGGDNAKGLVLRKNALIDGATRDAGNSPTTVLRRGLLLGKLSASGKMTEWDADAADGSQDIRGILNIELRAQDFDANNVDRAFGIIVRAPLLANQLLIQGTALTSHIDEYLARRQLVAAGCMLDDDPFGYLAGQGFRQQTITAEDHTIVADENGTTFLYTHTASATSTITLPVIQPGLEFDLVRAANSAEDFVIASADGGDMVIGNDVAANSVTWTTSGQMIGARMKVKAVYIGTTPKWLVELPDPPFGTGLTGGFAYAIGT